MGMSSSGPRSLSLLDAQERVSSGIFFMGSRLLSLFPEQSRNMSLSSDSGSRSLISRLEILSLLRFFVLLIQKRSSRPIAGGSGS